MENLEIIIEECKNNNPKAQNKLFLLCKDKLKPLCRYYCNNTLEIDDMFIEGFTKILNNINLWDDTYKFFTWASAIMKNHCINNTKKKYKHFEICVEVLPENLLPNETENRFEIEDIKYCISKIKPIEQKVIQLFYYENLSTYEIAKSLNIDHRNCRLIMHRARKHLKYELEKIEKLKNS